MPPIKVVACPILRTDGHSGLAWSKLTEIVALVFSEIRTSNDPRMMGPRNPTSFSSWMSRRVHCGGDGAVKAFDSSISVVCLAVSRYNCAL
jgi:hypothetical protein